jgi:hypothetical protein
MSEGGCTGKGFKKGDPRINRKGRPKSFDALRTLAQQIAHEEAIAKSGDPIVINGHIVTVSEMILRSWARDAKLQAHFIEVAYGKVPDKVELTGKDGGPVEVKSVGLSDEERANQIITILDEVRARQAGQSPTDPGAGTDPVDQG